VNGTLHKFVAVKFLTLAGSTWIVFLFGYLGILQIASLVLALKSRKIAIKVINDSKEIRTIVYITSFIALEMLILYFVVGNFNNTRVSLHIGHLLAATMVVLLITFIPKVLLLEHEVVNSVLLSIHYEVCRRVCRYPPFPHYISIYYICSFVIYIHCS